MTHRSNKDELDLPADLRALDEELSSIRYEERPSFGPELRAELAEQWAAQPRERPSAFRRHLVAATLAALLVGGAAVPSARASFIRLLGQLTPEPAALETPVPNAAPFLAAPVEEAVVAPIVVAPEPAPDVPVVEPIEAAVEVPFVLIPPEMIDRARSRRLLQAAYPEYLQRQGIGGVVWVRLWVDETGIPGGAAVTRSSGETALDRAAVQVAPRFTFAPALEGSTPVGKWIEFSVLFEPDPDRDDRPLKPAVDPLSLPTVARTSWWEMREPLDLGDLPAVETIGGPDAAGQIAAARTLGSVLTDPAIIDRYGPAEAILAAEAPEGIAPTSWRAAIGEALQSAIDGGTANPAAMLAFGRIRATQGLHTEARSLIERGLQMALEEPEAVGDWVLSELHYERASIVRTGWLASNGVGRVRAEAFELSECRQASSTGGAETGFASADRLIAWNYLCPMQLTEVFGRGFESTDRGSAADLTLMMASLRAAVEAYPGHVGANTDLLLTLASAERWEDVLSGARRFTRVSNGHPHGLLLAGLAQYRLERADEAARLFAAALPRMNDADADALGDVGFLLDAAELAWYRRVAPEERRAWEEDFWASKDRNPATEVNERWVQHMARSTFAFLRYGTVFGDASEVWVRFGGPNNVYIVDEGSGRLTEFWDYGRGPDLTFVRWVSSERTDLTPEGRAYVDDLGKIFPPQ